MVKISKNPDLNASEQITNQLKIFLLCDTTSASQSEPSMSWLSVSKQLIYFCFFLQMCKHLFHQEPREVPQVPARGGGGDDWEAVWHVCLSCTLIGHCSLNAPQLKHKRYPFLPPLPCLCVMNVLYKDVIMMYLCHWAVPAQCFEPIKGISVNRLFLRMFFVDDGYATAASR